MDGETIIVDGVLRVVRDKLGHTYEFGEQLGGGEFSKVYLVKHKQTGQDLAIKILDYHFLMQRLEKENLDDSKRKFDEIKKRFLMEVSLYEKIQHPNIVKIYDTGFIEEQENDLEVPYFIMSYIRGNSLAGVLRKKGKIEPQQAIAWARNILSALQAIHKEKIVHRDLKPANVMIDEETGEAIIIDFGISKDILAGTQLTITGAILGSPMYMAPEQFINSRDVGPGVDIYAFGVVLYQMLAGAPPFEGTFVEVMNAHRERSFPDPLKKNSSFPTRFIPVLTRAMAKEPANRFKTPQAFLTAIEEAKEYRDKSRPVRYIVLIALFLIAAGLGFIIFNPLSEPVDNSTITGPIREESVIRQPSEANDTATSPDTKPKEKQVTEPVSPPQPTPEEIKARAVAKLQTDFDTLMNELGQTPFDDIKKLNINRRLCVVFIDRYQKKTGELPEAKEKIKKANQVKEQLQHEINFLSNLQTVRNYIKNGRYDDALALLSKTEALIGDIRKVEKTKEIDALRSEIESNKAELERIHGSSSFNTIKEKITLSGFLSFQKEYPNSEHLEDLRKILYRAEPNLPPESYWSSPIRKNSRGYYEFTFGEDVNRHVMIYIPGKRFWIDKFEVSNSRFGRYLNATGQSVADDGKQKSSYINRDDPYPAVVTYNQAEAYCTNYRLRLPTKEEWEYAAGKNAGYAYPWGNAPPGNDNRWQANFDSLDPNSAKELDGFVGTAPVKSFQSFASAFGCVNMAGNVWEWVFGSFLKGGSFLSSSVELKITFSQPGSSNEKQGFRCVKDEI